MPGFADKLKKLQQQVEQGTQEERTKPAQTENQNRHEERAAKPPKPTQQQVSSGKRGRNFMLSPDVYELLDTLHWKLKMPLSGIVDEAIRQYAEDQGIAPE